MRHRIILRQLLRWTIRWFTDPAEITLGANQLQEKNRAQSFPSNSVLLSKLITNDVRVSRKLRAFHDRQILATEV